MLIPDLTIIASLFAGHPFLAYSAYTNYLLARVAIAFREAPQPHRRRRRRSARKLTS
jgi:hypothetical protein